MNICILSERHSFRIKYYHFCKPCLVLCFLAPTFFFKTFSIVRSQSFTRRPVTPISEWYVVWMKKKTWVDSETIVSSEDISDYQNNRRIGSGINPCFVRTAVPSLKWAQLLSLDCFSYPSSVPYIVKQDSSSTIFWVFGVTQLEMRDLFLGLLATI